MIKSPWKPEFSTKLFCKVLVQTRRSEYQVYDMILIMQIYDQERQFTINIFSFIYSILSTNEYLCISSHDILSLVMESKELLFSVISGVRFWDHLVQPRDIRGGHSYFNKFSTRQLLPLPKKIVDRGFNFKSF